MKNSIILITGLFVLLLISCEKDEYKSGSFSGIILTNTFGEIMGTGGKEDGDWTFTDNFSNKELSLFDQVFNCPEEDTSSAEQPQDTGIASELDTMNIWLNEPIKKFGSCYPNPASSLVSIRLDFPDGTMEYIKYVLVNKDFQILFKDCMLFSSGTVSLMISFQGMEGIQTGELHRLYYLADDGEGNYSHMGHGDILVTCESCNTDLGAGSK
jgi:hypothetical protein